MGTVYRIVNWDDHFENHKTRGLKQMRYVCVPNKFDGDRITDLIEQGGDAVYGAWCAMLMVASRCEPRGTLVRDGGKPHTAKSLARMTGISEENLSRCLNLAASVGLLESGAFGQESALDSEKSVQIHEESAHRRKEGKEGKEGNGMEEKGALESVLPENLNTPEFLSAWSEWMQYRRQRTLSTYTDISLKRQLNALAKFGPTIAVAAIDASITQNWQGLFPEKIHDRPTGHSANRRDPTGAAQARRTDAHRREFEQTVDVPDL